MSTKLRQRIAERLIKSIQKSEIKAGAKAKEITVLGQAFDTVKTELSSKASNTVKSVASGTVNFLDHSPVDVYNGAVNVVKSGVAKLSFKKKQTPVAVDVDAIARILSANPDFLKDLANAKTKTV